MSNRTNVSLGQLNSIIFKSAAASPIHQKFLSLFPGLGYAAGYKIAQRIYKFGGQPYFRDLIDSNGGGYFRDTFGKKWGGLMMQGVAGRWVHTRLYSGDADHGLQFDRSRRGCALQERAHRAITDGPLGAAAAGRAQDQDAD